MLSPHPTATAASMRSRRRWRFFGLICVGAAVILENFCKTNATPINNKELASAIDALTRATPCELKPGMRVSTFDTTSKDFASVFLGLGLESKVSISKIVETRKIVNMTSNNNTNEKIKELDQNDLANLKKGKKVNKMLALFLHTSSMRLVVDEFYNELTNGTHSQMENFGARIAELKSLFFIEQPQFESAIIALLAATTVQGKHIALRSVSTKASSEKINAFALAFKWLAPPDVLVYTKSTAKEEDGLNAVELFRNIHPNKFSKDHEKLFLLTRA